jgi:hypothetical protein
MQPWVLTNPAEIARSSQVANESGERDPWIAVAAAGVRLGTPPFGWFGGLALRERERDGGKPALGLDLSGQIAGEAPHSSCGRIRP